MITLREMSKERHDVWAANIWAVYYQELIQAGFSEDYAKENSTPDESNPVDYGKMNPGNFTLEVVLENQAIGNVWLVQKEFEWWIYDIEIDEPFRGQGFGRGAMRAIEDFVKNQGGKKLNLSVFGFNKVAQSLYLSEGFETIRIHMHKHLSD